MVSLADARFLLKSLNAVRTRNRQGRSDQRSVMVMRTAAPARRWRLKTEIDAKSSQPSFRWTKSVSRS